MLLAGWLAEEAAEISTSHLHFHGGEELTQKFINIPRSAPQSGTGVTFNFPLRDKNLLSAGDYFSPSPA